MFHLRRISLLTAILTCFLQAQGADKYTDENRPYEFGFNIEGEQHRHEKKDERGLIMGEFGFITADGVYHVTVYATDENGNFKILSMKNIRVKPYPTAPERRGNSLPFPPSQQAPISQGPTSAPPQQTPVSLEPPIKSCSHCSIPTTPKAPVLTDIAVVSRDNPAYNNPQYPQYPPYPNQQNYPQDNYPNQLGAQDYPNQPDPNYPNQPDPNYPNQPDPNYSNQPDANYPYQPDTQNYPQGAGVPQYPEENLQPGERNPKQFFPQQGSVPAKPQLISAQMQIVGKDTDIYQRKPGEKEGLPNGLTKKDMKLLLYTFNYTVGFHGHQEEGYTDGTKVGYYFITGRNGVRTRVDYVADENGFRPKITQEVLDLLSEDVPKPETEKDAKYGLKGYEFKWIYYPVDSKRR